MEWDRVGEVTHYFDQISVAAITLDDDLAVGDWIALVRDGELLFEQEITSMQIEHTNITIARAGDDVGLKVNENVKEGTEVYKRVS